MRLADGVEVSFPAWVALLDQHYSVLLKTYIRPEVRLLTNPQATAHKLLAVGSRLAAELA
jgi:hypothetical protein